jgi:hypothetical protein
MSCPICGANCRCRKRGPNGLCCGCHRHKARKILDTVAPREQLEGEMAASYDRHAKRIADDENSEATRTVRGSR